MKKSRRIELDTLQKLKRELLLLRLDEHQLHQDKVMYKRLKNIEENS